MKRILRLSLPAVVGGLLSFQALHAQTATLSGRVVDPAGDPVPELEVSLHRVTAAGGTEITRATSGPEGTFSLELPAADEGAIYFASTRYEGELFIGEPFRLPFPENARYVIVVGGDATFADAAAAMGAPAGAGAGPDGSPAGGAGAGWLMALGGLLAAAVLVGVSWAVHQRPPAHRRLLLQLAELDERCAEESDGAADAERCREARAELVERLKESTIA